MDPASHASGTPGPPAKPTLSAERSGAGYTRVCSPISCVITRFHLRSPFWMLVLYLHFRRVRHQARNIGGLLKTVFLVQGLRTCYTVSMWRDERSLLDFGTHVHAHVEAARSAFGASWNRNRNRPEIWSAQFRLWAVGANVNWDDLDLQAELSRSTFENGSPGGPGWSHVHV